MDLEKCPRCGAKWPGGDFCGSCGFVPIGAGIKNDKKKRKRRGKYVEPGSMRGSLAILFVGIIGIGAWVYKPWREDWALVRYWLGQGHIHNVAGEWDIVKAVSLKRGQSTLIAQRAAGGYFKFADKGKMKLTLRTANEDVSGEGLYKANGRNVSVVNLRTKDGVAKLPTTMNLALSWQNPDTVVASVSPNEVVYLRRRKEKGGLANLFHFGMKPSGSVGVPEPMKGVISSLKKQIENEQ